MTKTSVQRDLRSEVTYDSWVTDEALPLRGRTEELSRIANLLQEVGVSRPTIVVQGEPGIGKSRLVDEVARLCAAESRLVLRGSSTELEQDRPFGALIEALHLEDRRPPPEFESVAELLTGQPTSGVSTTPLHYRLLQRLLDALEEAARSRRVVLVLEDVHWADHGTLQFLSHLVRTSTDLDLVLILTRRTWPRAPELDRIEEARGVEVIRLAALSSEDAARVAEDLLGAAPLQQSMREMVDAAAGNPLLVVELVTALRDQPAAAGEEGELGVVADLPVSLRAALSRRLSYLSEGCLQMLRLASVLGSRFPFHDLQAATGMSATELLALVDEAMAAGILLGDEDRVGFRHDLLRTALYEDIPAAVRRGIHREVAGKLAGEGTPAATVAVHFSLGAKERDHEAAAWLQKAARAAAPQSPAIAADLLQRALQVADQDNAERDVMTSQLVTALLWSGQFHRAEARAEEMLIGGATPDTAAAVRFALGRVLVYRGDVPASLAQVEEALADERVSPGWRARLLAEASLRQLVCGRVKDAYESGISALDLAHEHDDPVAATVALCSLSRTAAYRSHTSESIDSALRAVREGAGQTVDAIQSVQPVLYLGLAQIDAGQLEAAQRSLEEGRSVADEIGARWILPLFHLGLGLVHMGAGRWDDSLVEAETALAAADEVDTRVWVPWTHALLAHLHVHRGRLEEAQRSLENVDRAIAAAPKQQFGWQWIALARAELSEALGDADGALQLLHSEWQERSAVERVGDHKLFGPMLARLLAGREGGAASEVAASLTLAAERSGKPAATAAAARARGWMEGEMASFDEAISAYDEAGLRHELAATCEEAADALGDALPRRERVDLLSRALDVYEELGAELDSARASRGLRSLGVRRGVRGRRTRPSTGWDSLTDTERNVVALVAEGLSNKEIGQRLFISHRTVGHHVSHILAKLGMSSRVELAAEMARAGATRE